MVSAVLLLALMLRVTSLVRSALKFHGSNIEFIGNEEGVKHHIDRIRRHGRRLILQH